VRLLSNLFDNNRAWANGIKARDGDFFTKLATQQNPDYLWSDLNCLSVMQYAVDVLGVEHIIVCGHYGCGGVRSALEGERHGLIDNWLRHIQDVRDKHASVVDSVPDPGRRCDRLCELNVIEQTINVCKTTLVQDAWLRDQALSVHGWIYDINDGLLRDLGICVTAPDEIATGYASALAWTREARD
jgi:carbonic anhydrase